MALTATVRPGLTFVDGETELTAANLNAIANPTVSVSGTVGGSTSVAVDGVTIDQAGTGSSLQVVDGGISVAKLADGALSADATGRAKMADGFVTAAELANNALSADTTGRAKMQDGFLTAEKVASTLLVPRSAAFATSATPTYCNNDIDISGHVYASNGDTVVTLAVTPQASNSILRVRAALLIGAPDPSDIGCALLTRQLSGGFSETACAVAPTGYLGVDAPGGGAVPSHVHIEYWYTCTGANTVTFRLKGAVITGSYVVANGINTTVDVGDGLGYSWISVEEWRP